MEKIKLNINDYMYEIEVEKNETLFCMYFVKN